MKTPSECTHDWYFITSHRQIGEHPSQAEVNVCRICGQFEVWGRENNQMFRVSFVLTTREGVDSASKYREMLEAEYPELVEENED